MDKNVIKKYAVWARRELISRVSQKALQYGIAEENTVPADAATVNGVVLSNEEKKQRRALIEKINDKGYQQVMEEVAYTWFNRFIALRFMEVNGYLPSHVRVFTDDENSFKPQILTEAINLDFDGLNMDKVFELKDANDNEALFKYLLIVQCNALNPIMPRMFQKISDYTELLFPDNLLREGSVVQQMIELIPEEDWKDAVQIIGWLYQYYNSEKKDEVFAALKKNIKITKDNIPAATQLFTPDWIVRYMVENSLGRLWVEGHPNDELKSEWKYYLDEAEQDADVQAQLTIIRKEYASITPEQIKCIDPCSGSGHILAYMFDVLMQIYEDYGYTAREAVGSIVKNNIYGLDIDERAAQLAYFSVMMKARQYDRRFFSLKDDEGNISVPQPQVYTIVESNCIDSYTLNYFIKDDIKLKAAINSIIEEMNDAKEYGSILNVTPVDFNLLYTRLYEVCDDINMNRENVLNEIFPLIKVAELLSQKYDVVITNPPYMGNSGMDAKLNNYVKENYPDSKSDFFSVFIEKCRDYTVDNGYYAMITQPSFLFLSSFEKLRKKILDQNTILNLLHLGRGIFGIDFGSTAFIIQNKKKDTYKGKYFKLYERTFQYLDPDHVAELFLLVKDNKNIKFDFSKYDTKKSLIEMLLDKNNAQNIAFEINQKDFEKIPGLPIAYWAPQGVIEAFTDGIPLGKLTVARNGMKTGDNNRFLRNWWEVDYTNMMLNAKNTNEAIKSHKKWFPYNKGGDSRKWYGNNEYVVNWEDGGREIFDMAKIDGRNVQDYPPEMKFVPAGTWSLISSGKPTFRYKENNISDIAGMSFYNGGSKTKYYLGFCNTNIAASILQMLAPTINYQAGDIARLPIYYDENKEELVLELVDECISISRSDWDSFETSWDFEKHPLIVKDDSLENAYNLWKEKCNQRINCLKINEERLNKLFSQIYHLEDEYSANVDYDEIVLHKAEKENDIKTFLSYAVGCMFGRYSLDESGVIYAGGKWDDSKYVTFKTDKDSIIPISDDEYFEDDIVNRFVRFIEVVYGKQSLEENLQFVAEALGGSGQSREVIRKYFMNDFYADHLKIYQKRPIYWLFDSGKKNGFKALVYMHRYQPDTIARMRTDYVHEQQSRYRTAIADLEQRIALAATSERVKLNKKLKTLKDQAAEIQVYEEKIHHLADQYISIDLDDGVKVNYAKFQDVLAKIK